MILIITHKLDYTADFVIVKLNERSIPYLRFNCEDYLKYEITVRSDHICINGISDFSAVWYRRVKLPEIQADNESERIYVLGEIDTFISNLWSVIDSKWLSNPFYVAQAENKLYQLKVASQVGFKVPRTLMTTRAEHLVNFLRQNDQTIIKPIGKGRIDYPNEKSKLIFTNIIPNDLADSIEDYTLTPAIFQEHIEKEYELRVTVISDDVYCARVNSQELSVTKLDWRRHPMKFVQYELPEEIKNKCIKMLRILNINFGAFDLIKNKSGEYIFLEVNPNGQWVWIEKDAGLTISESMINFLS